MSPVNGPSVSYLPEGTPVVPGLTSIVMLTYNGWSDTDLCLQSLAAYTPEPHELIVVDNGSHDGTIGRLTALLPFRANMRIIANPENLGFAGGNNQGMAMAHGEYIVLLNNDTVLPPGWLSTMLEVLHRYPDVGLVGPVSGGVSGSQLVPDVPYRAVDQLMAFAEEWAAAHRGEVTETSRLVGFCLLARRTVIQAIGGLDERFGKGNFEDDDFCMRAVLSGFKAVIARASYVHHTGGQTFRGANIDYTKSLEINWNILKQKWNLPPDVPLGQSINFTIMPDTLWRYHVPLRPVDPSLLLTWDGDQVPRAEAVPPKTAAEAAA